MAQHGLVGAHRLDMSPLVDAYERKRNLVMDMLSPLTQVEMPEGAFYAFPRVPDSLNCSATAFTDALLEHNVIAIPGEVFSQRNTHFRISYATADDRLKAGLQAVAVVLRGDGALASG